MSQARPPHSGRESGPVSWVYVLRRVDVAPLAAAPVARPFANELLLGRVADLHFTVSHRQPTLIAIDEQPGPAGAFAG